MKRVAFPLCVGLCFVFVFDFVFVFVFVLEASVLAYLPLTPAVAVVACVGCISFQELCSGRPQQPAGGAAVHLAGSRRQGRQSAHPVLRGFVRPGRVPPVPQHLA